MRSTLCRHHRERAPGTDRNTKGLTVGYVLTISFCLYWQGTDTPTVIQILYALYRTPSVHRSFSLYFVQ